jgi:2-polyprenyl-3-methyl-5-hydroxy-6-metoxy-1,4-benzoquinol methylase
MNSLKNSWSNTKINILSFLFLIRSDCPFQERMSWLDKNLPKAKNKHLLDIGCGDGYAVIIASKKGWDSTGMSFEKDMLDYARKWSDKLGQPTNKFIHGNIKNLREILPKGTKYNAIICMEILEHIKDDRKLVHDASLLLKTGGRLYVSVPNILYKPMIGDKLSTKEDGGHVRWGYTFEQLEKMTSEAGMKVVKKEKTSGWVSQMIVNLQRFTEMRLGSKVSVLLTLPFRLLLPFDKVITAVSRYPYSSLHIVAIKK